MTKMVLGTLIGAGVGYAYYLIVGCTTGACWITASGWTSGAYFGLLGWVIGGGARVLDRLWQRLVALLPHRGA